jgi:hypothetical protein
MAYFKRSYCAALVLGVSLVTRFTNAQSRLENSLWISDGYGLLVEVTNDKLRTLQLTSISCIPGWSAQRNNRDESKLLIFIGYDTVRLSDGSSSDEKRLHLDGTASDIILHRTIDRPVVCSQTADNSPQVNYAIFWQTFAEHYPFFELRKMDWMFADREFRSRINSATTPDLLFETLRQMIAPLRDAHTGIDATDIKKDFHGWRNDSNHLSDEDWKRAENLIASRYVHGGLRSFCNGRVQFGMLDHELGYLTITAFYGYAEGSTYKGELRALQLALDSIFQNANTLNGLVIDVRLNHGGDDPLGIEIASRFTDTRYLAYAKVARNNRTGPLHFTVPQQIWVEPSSRPGFRGNVVLLTGPDTVSAGETFVMALMGRKPCILRIGANTQGVFSDVLNRTLPNGWKFRLPNEIYLTADGKAFDGTGLPPDVPVNFLTHEDLNLGRDAALEEAQTVLRGRRIKAAAASP